ncbi:MAG: hypothetical protein JWN15_2148 [Firmicutes bacterium]|nr:hypothetical protein [Bacillota bacterium]
MLSVWVKLLNVTEPFARGQISKYHVTSGDCAGLAADIGTLVTAGRSDLPNWDDLNERERVREVLRLIAHESRHLPRVVLAWVLDLRLKTLDAILVGDHPVMQTHMQAVATLTTLPEQFFTLGRTAQFEQYVPVFQRAVELRMSPQTLLDLMEPPSCGSSGDRLGGVQNDGPLGSGGGSRDNGEEHRQNQQQPD